MYSKYNPKSIFLVGGMEPHPRRKARALCESC